MEIPEIEFIKIYDFVEPAQSNEIGNGETADKFQPGIEIKALYFGDMESFLHLMDDLHEHGIRAGVSSTEGRRLLNIGMGVNF